MMRKPDTILDEIHATRRKIYEEVKDMTYPELRIYLDKRMENSVLWQRLVNRDRTQLHNLTFVER